MQGHPTRGPREVLKWPAKGFNIIWLIDLYSLTRHCELQKRVLKLLFYLRFWRTPQNPSKLVD